MIRFIIILILPGWLLSQDIFTVETPSPNFVFHHTASLEKDALRRIIDQIESDYREFRYFFNLTAAGRPKVVIHNNIVSFIDTPFTHPWEVGTVFNDEIHIAPPDIIREKTVLPVVLTQQVVRLVLYSRRMNGCPRWLYEGAAGYFAGFHNVQTLPMREQIRTLSDLNELFTNPRNENEYNSAVYISAVTFAFMMRKYGETNVVTLLRLFNGEFEFDQAVPYSLGVTAENLERTWLSGLSHLLAE